MTMLEIKDLHASVEDKKILKGLNLTVNAGEVHAIMGPNGSGKSTLSQVLAGREAFEVTGGSVTYMGHDLLELHYEERPRPELFFVPTSPLHSAGVAIVFYLRPA